MAAPTDREVKPLPSGHACVGCQVRGRAVCGVLDCESLAEFKKLGPTFRLFAGQTLFREGDAVSRVFTLTSGSLKLYKLLPDGRRQIVGFMYPGEFLGLSIDDEHAFTAELMEDASFCSLPRGKFERFLAEHSSMEHELYRMAAHELNAMQQQLVLLGRKTATERLATFLLLLAKKAEQIHGNTSTVLHLPMSRADIADYLGLTKETVSRVFSAFRAARLIRLRALNEVELINPENLERVSENEAMQ